MTDQNNPQTPPVSPISEGMGGPQSPVAQTNAADNPAQAPTLAAQFDDGEARHSETAEAPDALHGAKIPSRSPDTIEVGGDTAQAAAFAAVVSDGRPSTIEVKRVLETLEGHASRLWKLGYCGQAVDLRYANGIIDRLGCALIAQDVELADADRALDVVARAAIPLDDAALAELVQEARIWVDKLTPSAGRHIGIVTDRVADTITRLIMAVLDQARKAQGIDFPAALKHAVDAEKARHDWAHETLREIDEAVPEDWQQRGYATKMAAVIDLAQLGESLTTEIATHTGTNGALAGWMPAYSSVEIVTDLVNQRDDARAEVAQLKAEKGEAFDITKPRSPRQNALLAIDVLAAHAESDGPFTTRDAVCVIGSLRQLLAERDDLELHRDAARDALSDVRDERDKAEQALEALTPIDATPAIGECEKAVREHVFGTGTMTVDGWSTLASRLRWDVMEERDRTRRAVEESDRLKGLHSETLAELTAKIEIRDDRIRDLERERDAFGEQVERLTERQDDHLSPAMKAVAEAMGAVAKDFGDAILKACGGSGGNAIGGDAAIKLSARMTRLEDRVEKMDEIPF